MRKCIIAIVLLTSVSYAATSKRFEINSAGMAKVVAGNDYVSGQSTRVTRGFSFYVVGGATTSAIIYKRFVSSMAVTATAGLYPGTTHFVYADSDKDTMEEFVTYLNAVPDTTIGCEGGVVATIDAECYEGNLTAEITANVTAVTVHSSTNPSTVGLDNILGMYKALTPDSGNTYFLQDMIANVTFGAGTTSINVRNGDNDDSTRTYQQKITTSATDEPMDSDLVAGSVDTALRFEVIGSSWISAGQFSYTAYQH